MSNGTLHGAIVWAAFAASAAAWPALAADPSDSDTAKFEVTVAQSTFYDSNVSRSAPAFAAQRGLTPRDVIFTPSLAIDWVRPFGRETIFVEGFAGYNFYDRNQKLNGEQLNLRGGVKARIWRCKTTLTDSYARSQSDLQDLNLPIARNTQDVETVGLQSDCGGAVGLSPNLDVSEQWSNNSNLTVQPTDYRAFTAIAGLGYRRPSLGEVSVFGSFEHVGFPDHALGVEPVSTQVAYGLYSGGLSYNHRLGARIAATLKLGYDVLRPDVAGLPGFSGLVYGADVVARVTGRVEVHLDFERTVTPAARQDVTYSLANTYSAQLDYAVSPRLKLSVGASRVSSRNEGPILASRLDLRFDTVTDAYGQIRLDLSRRLALTLSLRREARQADPAVFDYADTQVGLTLSKAL